MQFVSATPLVHQFKSGRFQASEVGPYFMASTTVTAALWIFGFGQPGVWSVGGRVASVVITVFGLLHLKERNLGTFGNEFFYKYFCLGWVVTVRMFLLLGAFGMVLGAFGFGRDGSDAPRGHDRHRRIRDRVLWVVGRLVCPSQLTTRWVDLPEYGFNRSDHVMSTQPGTQSLKLETNPC